MPTLISCDVHDDILQVPLVTAHFIFSCQLPNELRSPWTYFYVFYQASLSVGKATNHFKLHDKINCVSGVFIPDVTLNRCIDVATWILLFLIARSKEIFKTFPPAGALTELGFLYHGYSLFIYI